MEVEMEIPVVRGSTNDMPKKHCKLVVTLDLSF